MPTAIYAPPSLQVHSFETRIKHISNLMDHFKSTTNCDKKSAPDNDGISNTLNPYPPKTKKLTHMPKTGTNRPTLKQKCIVLF